jgi:two-component system CitB family sensor kinase
MLLVAGSGVIVALVAADRLVRQGAEDRVLSMARAVAATPGVQEALTGPDPTQRLQPLAERLRQDANVSFVVVMSPAGIRYSHPNPEMIGHTFIGTIEPAVAGGVVVETYVGTLGPSVRAVVPVAPLTAGPGDPSRPIGLVSVGVTVNRVSNELNRVVPLLLGTAILALLLAAGASWWISRRLARQTFGMGAAELARMYAHHDAVLHGIREGLLVVDNDRRVVLANDAARELLGVGLGPDDDPRGRPVADLPLAGTLAELLASGRTVEDEPHLAGERLVVVSQVPIGARSPDPAPGSDTLGTVLTLRDHTQVTALADELSATRSMADTLRANVHESANRLHTVVMLAQLGDVDAAVDLATGEVRATKMLTNRLVAQFEEPTLVALLLGKTAEATQRSVELVVTPGSRLTAAFPEPADLVTIVGNLVDNAIDAALDVPVPPPACVEVAIGTAGGELVVQVRDSGPGFSAEARANVFEPGWSTKPATAERRHGRGIGMALVSQVVCRRGGRITVANATDPADPADRRRLPARPGRDGLRSSADAAGTSGPDGSTTSSGARDRARPGGPERPALGGAVVTVHLPLPPEEGAPSGARPRQ